MLALQGWAVSVYSIPGHWLCHIGARTEGSVTIGWTKDTVNGKHPTSIRLAATSAIEAFQIAHPEVCSQ